MISGIYKWTSPSGKSYIGQSSNLQLRRKQFETLITFTQLVVKLLMQEINIMIFHFGLMKYLNIVI